MREKTVTLEGLFSESLYGDSLSLVTYVEAIDVINYFSVFNVPIELESVFQSIHGRINTNRLNDALIDITKGIKNQGDAPLLALSFGICGDITLTKTSNKLAKIHYKPTNTLIIDGVITLFAIMNLMGFSHPFLKKRASKALIENNSKIRQELAQLPIQITVIFNQKIKKNSSHLIEIYKVYNKKETRLHTPLLNIVNTDNAINDYIQVIASSIKLDDYGGMTNITNRLTKSDPYITTEATMVRLVLGALGGPEVQDKNKASEFGQEFGPLSQIKSLNAQPLIIAFMQSWLIMVKPQLKNRDGYHYSSQLWQALSLVIYNLLKRTTTEIDIRNAAKIVGKLNYSKNASHWKHCDVMILDASKTYYKNSTGGGRAFRVGLSKYFLEIIDKYKD